MRTGTQLSDSEGSVLNSHLILASCITGECVPQLPGDNAVLYLTYACCMFFLFQELSDALGISIAGGKGSPLGDIPIFIAMIQANGVAARTQKLKVNKSNWLKC